MNYAHHTCQISPSNVYTCMDTVAAVIMAFGYLRQMGPCAWVPAWSLGTRQSFPAPIIPAPTRPLRPPHLRLRAHQCITPTPQHRQARGAWRTTHVLLFRSVPVACCGNHDPATTRVPPSRTKSMEHARVEAGHQNQHTQTSPESHHPTEHKNHTKRHINASKNKGLTCGSRPPGQ